LGASFAAGIGRTGRTNAAARLNRGQTPESSIDFAAERARHLIFLKGKLYDVADDDGRKGI
jgi:hypothetical protein